MDSSANAGRWRWGRDAGRVEVAGGAAQGNACLAAGGSGAAAGLDAQKGAEKGASQAGRQRWALPAGLAEQDLMRGYAQAVGQ